MATSGVICAYCGKRSSVVLKKCSVCRDASYCGAACQKAGWKQHKKACAPPLPLVEVYHTMKAANIARDWRGVLKLEGRMEELLEGQADPMVDFILCVFKDNHTLGFTSTGSRDHALSIVRLEERRVQVLGKVERFKDQGGVLNNIADYLIFPLERREEGAVFYQRARDVGAAHGFFALESKSCRGLGELAMMDGRHEEGLDLLRNALAASSLNEFDDFSYEMNALEGLTSALFETNGIDEVEPLVQRYQEVAQAFSRKEGKFTYAELHSLIASARLHEARGRPQEAEKEVRALLDLVRENRASMHTILCGQVLRKASGQLKILDPEVGDGELIESVAVELARLGRC